MKPGFQTFFRTAPLVLMAAAVLSTAACDDGFGPLAWPAIPDTAALFSLSRLDYLGMPGAYDVLGQTPVIVEAQNRFEQWDVALTETDAGLQLLPAGAVTGFSIRPGIAIDSVDTFENVAVAPRDTAAYTTDGPVAVRTDVVYVIRTRRDAFQRCFHYGKLEILEMDPAEGTVRLRSVVNPFCSDRALIPPDED